MLKTTFKLVIFTFSLIMYCLAGETSARLESYNYDFANPQYATVTLISISSIGICAFLLLEFWFQANKKIRENKKVKLELH